MIPSFTDSIFGGDGNDVVDNATAIGKASATKATTLSSGTAAGATTANLVSATGFAVGKLVQFSNTERRIVSGISSNAISWVGGLTNAYASGTPVVAYQHERVYMPEGVYRFGVSALKDLHLLGPGPLNGGSYFNQLRTLDTNPGYNDDPEYNPNGEDKVNHFADVEYAILNASPPRSDHLTPATETRTLDGAIDAEDVSAVLNSVTGFTTGMIIVFDGGDTRTIQTIDRNTNTITWEEPLDNGYADGAPVVGTVKNKARDYLGVQWAPHFTKLKSRAGSGYSGATTRMFGTNSTATFAYSTAAAAIAAGSTNCILNSGTIGFVVGQCVSFRPDASAPVLEQRVITGKIGSTVAAGITAGATSCTVANGAGYAVGKTVGFADAATLAVKETRVLTNVAGNVLTWTGGLSNSYPVVTAFVARGISWATPLKNAYPITTTVVTVSNECELADASDFAIDDPVGFAADASSGFLEVREITAISDDTITWDPALPLWYTPVSALAALGVMKDAESCNVISTEGLAADASVGFGADQDGPWTDVRTIDDIDGTTIEWSGGLTRDYPMVSGYAGPIMSVGSRTANFPYGVIHDASGGGDNFAYYANVNLDYAKTAGQIEPANAATGSILNGHVTLLGNGIYGTCTELYVESTGGNNSAIADIRVLTRTDDIWTGEPSYWGGALLSAAGDTPCDWGWALHGKWRVGLDMCEADLTAGSQAAINLKDSQRIYLNSKGAFAYTGGHASYAGNRGNNFYGNYLGDSYIGHGGDYLSLVKGTSILSLGASTMTVNVPTELASLYSGAFVSSKLFNIYDSGAALRGYISMSNAAGVNSVDIYSGTTYRLKVKDDGSMAFNGSLTTAGAINSTTSLSAGTTLSVAGAASINGLSTLGSASVTTTLSVGGAVSFSGSLSVGGTVTVGGLNATSLSTGSGTISGGAITGSSLNVSSGSISGGSITGSSLNVSSGSISGGAITGSSLNVSAGSITGGALTVGSVSCGSITSSGNVTALSGMVTGQYMKTQSGTGLGSHIIYFGDQTGGATYMIVDTNGGAGAIYIKGVHKLGF